MAQITSRSSKRLFLYVCLTVVVSILAFVIGFFSRSTSSDKCEVNGKRNTQTDAEREAVFQQMVDSMKAENLRDNLRFFAKKPHFASSQRTNDISEEIYNRFKSYNFHAEYHTYDTLLSFPDPSEPNHVAVVDQSGSQLFRSKLMESFLEPSENSSNLLQPFLAYGANGTVEADLVYANYGRQQDFDELISKYNISIMNKIVLVKYGKSGRGAKVDMATKYGAVGVLIFGDPKDYAPVPSNKFPNGRWLSDDGVQRGSIMGNTVTVDGDPLTMGYPAKDWLYHKKISDVKGLPKIPAQPIAAADAQRLLEFMGGDVVPEAWKGDLNVSYKFGPFDNKTLKVKLVVSNQLTMKKIRNVCGTLYGSVEPDRYVLLGNHIDAWVFGAVDASSGTAVMMEIARALGEKTKSGWKPRRTIKLCGWDGEEFNLIGSCEYVEEFYNQLKNKAVAYINIDSAVAGNYSLQTKASPLLQEMMFKVHKLVPDPYIPDTTVFEKCKMAYKDKENPTKHKIYGLSGGTDYYAFYQFLGIPSIDMGYRQMDLDKKYNTSYYPMYHTLHDTVYWMENFVDKEYKIHLTVARVALYYLLQISDSPIIPFDANTYASGMQKAVKKLLNVIRLLGGNIEDLNLNPLVMSTKNFTTAVKELSQEVKKIDIQNVLQLRMLNDKLMQLEKGFTYPTGIPGMPQVKHYVMAPSRSAVDYSFPFPAIAGFLPAINKTQSREELKKQISITTYLIQSVAESLTEPVV